MLLDSYHYLYFVFNGLHTHMHAQTLINTVRYKILEGKNFGKFGEFPVIRQNFLVQNFLLQKICTCN